MSEFFGISKTGVHFVPLLFAGDINVYSMARAFHEEYDTVSYVYGKYMTGPCINSQIINYTANEKADDPEVFMSLVEAFAEEHKDEKVLLIGCGDSYVDCISASKDKLPENVIAPYIDIELMRSLTDKERFYELCEKTGIDYPDTFVYKPSMGQDFELPFGGPFIVKPANSVTYWQHPFAEQKKVFKLDKLSQVYSTVKAITDAGYTDSIIIQNCIPGDDSYMRVLTSYSDRNGKVKMMCLGHVLLEEHTPHGIGNHAVIITEENKELMDRFKALLEELKFTGFSNFDIKYDERDGKFKAFEINTRQGRSNYYVTGSGANLAKYVVEDRIDGLDEETYYVKNENLWTVLPWKVMEKYVNKAYTGKMQELRNEGKIVHPLFYDFDLTPEKKKSLIKNQLGQFYKYWKYMKK